MNIGDKVNYLGKEFEICGLSTMIYDKDCEGEPEWKHTHEIQEVGLVEPFESKQVFVKPTWVSVKLLTDSVQGQPEVTKSGESLAS